MDKNINIFNNLETNIKYDNYFLEIDNINYINYRCSFNKYLKRFINKCKIYNINYFFTSNNKYYILNKINIIEQVNYLKQEIIKLHHKLLTNMIENNTLDTEQYLLFNKEITMKNYNKLKKYDDFIDLINIIYNYNLLEIDQYKNINIDFQKEYTNLVNLSNLSDIYYNNYNDNIILIDEYSNSI